jgi:hypothetical protein
MWDFVMDKSGAGAGFLREQSSSLPPEAGTIGQEWPQCQQPHKPNEKTVFILLIGTMYSA